MRRASDLTPGPALVPPLMAERYRIGRVRSASSLGALHLAEDTRSGHTVVIKTVDAVAGAHRASQFPAIVRFLRRFNQQNCVRVIDDGIAVDGTPFAVMPLVGDERLQDRIDRGRLEPTEAAAITAAILRGLAHVHRLGGVHRHLRPECIMLTNGNPDAACITGFWSASTPQEVGEQRAVVVSDLTVGTPEYMSPEQALGIAADAGSDLYGVGIILFEMLHGRPPFTATEPFGVVQMQASAPLPALSANIPEPLQAILRRLTHKDPTDRFAAASEAVIALEQFVQGRRAPPLPAVIDPQGPVGGQMFVEPPGITGATVVGPPPSAGQVFVGPPADADPDIDTEANGRARPWLWMGIAGAAVALAFAVSIMWSTADPEVGAGLATPDGSDDSPATLDLSPTLRALALVNEADPTAALPYGERHQAIGELVAQGHEDKIDASIQDGLDLVQAAASPTPCTTFGDALTGLADASEGIADAYLDVAEVPTDAPGAGEAPDGSCDGLAARLATARGAAVAKPVPDAVADSPASEPAAEAPRRARSRRARKPRRPEPRSPPADASVGDGEPTSSKPAADPAQPTPRSSNVDLSEIQKLDNEIKRL